MRLAEIDQIRDRSGQDPFRDGPLSSILQRNQWGRRSNSGAPAEVSYTVASSTPLMREDEDGPIVKSRTPEVELPAVAETQAEVPSEQPKSSAGLSGVSPDCEVTDARETEESHACDEPGTQPFRFDDPYWDDAFDSYHTPTLRVCCKR